MLTSGYLENHRSHFGSERPIFNDPEQVIFDPKLSKAEKRALLASWASDAYSIENAPGQRMLPTGAVVSLACIMTALYRLDAEDEVAPNPKCGRPVRIPSLRLICKRPASSRDDDDDPPPSPAAVSIPLAFTQAYAEAA